MSVNPLKQYFRRPAIYIKLPSNYQYYDESVIDLPENGELPVFPMTAIDEMTSRTPDALYNGHAVAEIIKSCIPSIKDPWKINAIDLDTILISIRIASNGEEMDVNSTCPECKTEGKYGVSLLDVLQRKQVADYSESLKLRDLEIKFRPLSYTESNKNNLAQYEVQKMLVMLDGMEDGDAKTTQTKESIKKLHSLMSDAISSTIEYIQTPESVVTEREFIKEFVENCDKRTNTAIKDYSIQLREKNELKPLQIKCSNCSHDYQQSLVLNMTDFFV